MNIKLNTRYLGLDLPHPFVVGASPLINHLERVREIEDAGAAAIVMHSLFEEQILYEDLAEHAYIQGHEETFAEATSYFPRASEFVFNAETYLEQIQKIKNMVSIPVIGSLNGRTPMGWTDYAQKIEQAGADALELNLYTQPSVKEIDPNQIESNAIEVVRSICQKVKIPVAVKLSPYYTSLPHFARQLEEAGASGLVIFNRFYQPDIDIETLNTVPYLQLSESSELPLRLRWLAILYGRYRLDLACTGGVHTSTDAIKAVMSGADVVQTVSVLLKMGVGYLRTLISSMAQWMEEHEYESLEEMKGSMSYAHTPNPEVIERANYVKLLTDAQLRDRFGPVKW